MKSKVEKNIIEIIDNAKKDLEEYFKKHWKWQGDYWCGCGECIKSEERRDLISKEFITLCENALGLEFQRVCELFESSTGRELVEKSVWYEDCYYFKSSSNRIVPFFEERLIYNFFKNETDADFF